VTAPYPYPPPDLIIQTVAERMSLPVDRVRGGRQGCVTRSVANARAICLYAARRRGYEPSHFGDLMGLAAKHASTYTANADRAEESEDLRAAAEVFLSRIDGDAWRQEERRRIEVNCD
jgi:hypothetical protein